MTDAMHIIINSLSDLGIPAANIHPQAKVQSDLRLDSTEAVQIALDLKKAFDLSVKIDFSADPTLAEIADLVQANLTSKAV
jgi:acyl carrier protein